MESRKERIVVTGGAGFIGSHFVDLALTKGAEVIVLDAFTYSGSEDNLREAQAKGGSNYRLVKGRIEDAALVQQIFSDFRPTSVVNFAAESHVDRSITDGDPFLETNVRGTYVLLKAARKYFEGLQEELRNQFRFVQISTDEVFGSLGAEGVFYEDSPYRPRSPYSASKAAADHFTRAAFHTHGLPTLVTHCSNNFGPRQFPEKLIPFMIAKALRGDSLPVYGDGSNRRDWIYVTDHCEGIYLALQKGQVGGTFCFAGHQELSNLELVKMLCEILDRLKPEKKSYTERITFVTDRLGHDWRYALDNSKTVKSLGFQLAHRDFKKSLETTIAWYLKP